MEGQEVQQPVNDAALTEKQINLLTQFKQLVNDLLEDITEEERRCCGKFLVLPNP